MRTDARLLRHLFALRVAVLLVPQLIMGAALATAAPKPDGTTIDSAPPAVGHPPQSAEHAE